MRRVVKHLVVFTTGTETCDQRVGHWLKENPHLELVDCELDIDVNLSETAIKITAQPRLERMICNIAKKGPYFLKMSAENTALANEVVNHFANDGWNLEHTTTAVSSSADSADHDHTIVWAIISTLTFAREVALPTPSTKIKN